MNPVLVDVCVVVVEGYAAGVSEIWKSVESWVTSKSWPVRVANAPTLQQALAGEFVEVPFCQSNLMPVIVGTAPMS